LRCALAGALRDGAQRDTGNEVGEKGADFLDGHAGAADAVELDGWSVQAAATFAARTLAPMISSHSMKATSPNWAGKAMLERRSS
jgi:hypothetical protein